MHPRVEAQGHQDAEVWHRPLTGQSHFLDDLRDDDAGYVGPDGWAIGWFQFLVPQLERRKTIHDDDVAMDAHIHLGM
jgi:hypothetical protein